MKRPAYSFVVEQFKSVPPLPEVDLAGKTVIVTGANTGIGYEAAKHFADMKPAKLILACRSLKKGEGAVAKLKEETGFELAECWTLNLSSFASVAEFATRFEKECDRLDILLANAAVAKFTYDTTQDGWEETLQVNHLSTSLLCLLLLPRIVQTSVRYPKSQPRITVVSSEVHYWTKFEDKVLQSPNPLKTFSSQEYCTPAVMGVRYQDSKLLNVFFARSLSDILKRKGIDVVVNAPNPGYCYSELRRNMTMRDKIFHYFLDLAIARTSEQGSRPLVWAATGSVDGDVEKMKGAYVNVLRVDEPSDYVLEQEGPGKAQEILWNDTLRVLQEAEPRVEAIIRDLF